jgi:hypothetical protein
MTDELNHLAELLKDPEKIRADIAELIQVRKEADAARENLKQSMVVNEKTKIDTEAFVNKRKAELAQAQQTHDASAKESAARIKVGNDQAAELLRIKTDLDKREAAVKTREAEAVAKVATADAQTVQLDKWRREVLALKESLQKKHAALVKAMQEG